MGAVILHRRRRNQSLFDEPGAGLTYSDIRQAGAQLAQYWRDYPGVASARDRFKQWWATGRHSSNLTESDALKAFIDGWTEKQRNPPRVTQRDVDYAAGHYQRSLELYGENNMQTQRDYFRYVELRDAFEAAHPKARERRMSILRR